MAFKIAASMALKEAAKKCKPVLLEPIMSVEVTAPSEYLGSVMGDITKRRGKVFGMESDKGKTVISGEVPMAEMHRYAIDLRSMTQGRGTFSMEFARYDEVPAGNVAKMIEDEKKKRAK